jgi:hypothetical protein
MIKIVWVIAIILVVTSVLGHLTAPPDTGDAYTRSLDRKAAAIRLERKEKLDLELHMLVQDMNRRAKP